MFKSLKKESHRVGFVQMLTAQQERLGKYSHWDLAYRKKLAKRKIAAEKLL